MNLDLATRLENDIEVALEQGDLERAETLARRYVAEARLSPNEEGVPPLFRSQWLWAQVAVAQGRLEEASHRLAALFPLSSGLPAALACRVHLTLAEVQARHGQHAQARAMLDRLGNRSALMRSNPLLYLRELRVRLLLGEVETLHRELEACRRLLEAGKDLANWALLLVEEGRAWDRLGRLDRAGELWRLAESSTRSLGEDPIRADALLHLGRLAHVQGHLQLALDRFDDALQATSVTVQQHEIRLRRLLVLLELNQQSQARFELDRLEHNWRNHPAPEELLPLMDMARALVRGEVGSDGELAAYQATRRGDLDRARMLYLQALQETDAPARRARHCLALGLLALESGQATEARIWLNQSLHLAEAHGLPEVHWRALQGLGRLAAEFEGEEERAREFLERAVLVSESQSQKLRARLDAVTHGLRREGISKALLQGACRRGDVDAVFRLQESERGRLLVELCRSIPPGGRHRRLMDDPRLEAIDARLNSEGNEVGREQLLLTRERLLDEYLRDRTRMEHSALPRMPSIAELAQALPEGTLYLAPIFLEDELYLLACPSRGPARIVGGAGSARALRQRIAELRQCIDGQLQRYQMNFPLGPPERQELEGKLDALGATLLGETLHTALSTCPSEIKRIVWVPDGPLHGIPLHALRLGGRYLVEQYEVVGSFGGSLVVHHANTRGRRSWFARALVLAESPSILPQAAEEARGVRATFPRGTLLSGSQASREALRGWLGSAHVVHFACHAYFDQQQPLSASIGLPSGESWRALEWLDEPLTGLPLVTLSACRSAEVGPLAGKEVFGLVTGLLAAGVRAVLAGLWPVADAEALPFMWRFYRHRLTNDLPTALARTQREMLALPGSSPLFWAAFGLFGDPRALPSPGPWTRWLAARRQAWHARHFPVLSPP